MTSESHCQKAPARVLVVEDDAVTRAILTAQLNQLGFAASEATSATEALDLLRRQRFALAIIDLRIGGSDGVTILRHHRRSSHANPEMQAIAISARIDHALEQQLRQAGFAAWLPKPVTLTHLKKAIRTCLSASRGIPGGREEDTPRDRRLGQVQQAVQMKFLSELPRQLAMIENAVGQRQWRLALEIAHKLQG
ncbi:MAG TPA: response regulator, partial [Methylothermaceae bacterium]|nr:response regulator [Methylothermaceae bacterium]